jgi:hypothetical protein
MKTTLNNEIKITLELNEEESQWLHDVMQNPLYEQYPNQEDAHDKTMRERFFKATFTQVKDSV